MNDQNVYICENNVKIRMETPKINLKIECENVKELCL